MAGNPVKNGTEGFNYEKIDKLLHRNKDIQRWICYHGSSLKKNDLQSAQSLQEHPSQNNFKYCIVECGSKVVVYLVFIPL